MKTSDAFPPTQLDLGLKRPGPQTYQVYFRNDLLWAEQEITADTPEQALAQAQQLVTNNLRNLDFQYYEVPDCEVSEIERH